MRLLQSVPKESETDEGREGMPSPRYPASLPSRRKKRTTFGAGTDADIDTKFLETIHVAPRGVSGVNNSEERRRGETVEEDIRGDTPFTLDTVHEFLRLFLEMYVKGLAAFLRPLPESLKLLHGDCPQRVS